MRARPASKVARAVIAALLVLSAAATHAQGEPQAQPSGAGIVILVRHAEKQPEKSDPPLSPAGERRALDLRDALAAYSLAAIVVSDVRRTRQTAAPTAELHQLTPVIAKTGDGLPAHVAEIVQRIHESNGKGAVLVVGHSNTLPAIVEALGSLKLADLPECRFDALWMLDRRAAAGVPPGLVRTRYGAPSNCGAAGQE